jgi:acetyl esterase
MVRSLESPLRRRLRARLGAARAGTLDWFAHAFARVRYSMPDARPHRLKLVVERDVVYGPTSASCHRLDVYSPARAPKPWPVVMYVHGGGFGMLSKETHRVMAYAFARPGYIVFNVNYRLGPRYLYPAPLEDVADALTWVVANCARYGGDPNRIALAGESAGGNLVTALSVMTCFRRPEPIAKRIFDAAIPLRAVVATYPFIDLTETDRYLSHPKLSKWTKGLVLDASLSYLGPDARRVAHGAPLASPLLILENDTPPVRSLPPFFVSCGTKDPLLSQSRRLKAALDRLGAPCELLVAPGEVHGYDAMVWRPAAREKWKAAHQFLADAMGGVPTKITTQVSGERDA